MKSKNPPSFPAPERLLRSLKALLKLLRSLKLKGNFSKVIIVKSEDWWLMCLITLSSEILNYDKKRSIFFQNYLKILHLLKEAVDSHLFHLLIQLQLSSGGKSNLSLGFWGGKNCNSFIAKCSTPLTRHSFVDWLFFQHHTHNFSNKN